MCTVVLQLYSKVNENLMDIIFSKFFMSSSAGGQVQHKGLICVLSMYQKSIVCIRPSDKVIGRMKWDK